MSQNLARSARYNVVHQIKSHKQSSRFYLIHISWGITQISGEMKLSSDSCECEIRNYRNELKLRNTGKYLESPG